jgi:hypothetical protein
MLLRLLAQFVLLLGLGWPVHLSAAEAAGEPADTFKRQDLEALRKEAQIIRSLIDHELGDPIADDPEQCGVMPIGATPCGSPGGYLVYSRQVSDPVRLKELADRYRRLATAQNRITQAVGPCMMPREPRPVIVEGRCRASFQHYDSEK